MEKEFNDMEESVKVLDNTINNVLIVEDEEALLFGLEKLLKTPGINIFAAQTLDQAKALLTKRSFKAVITDLRLTGTTLMEGMEVIKMAKESQPNCKIIAMTAYVDNEVKNEVEKLGVDFYLEKPVSPKTIRDILASF